MSEFKSVKCNICNSEKKISVGLPEKNEAERKGVNLPENFYVAKCLNCGFYYTYPMPFWSKEDLKKLYETSYFPEYSDWWKNIRNNINPNRRFDTIQKFLPKNSSTINFLEIGCGEALALKQAINRGWKVYGQDVAGNFKEKIYQETGTEIFVGFLEDAAYPSNFFDVVYFDSVIEHLPEPSSFIKEIYRILKPNGIAYIICPNEDSFASKIKEIELKLRKKSGSAKIMPFVNPYHINGFSKSSITMLTAKNAFEILKLEFSADYRAYDTKKYLKKEKINMKEKIYRMFYSIVYFIGNLIGMSSNLEVILSAKK